MSLQAELDELLSNAQEHIDNLKQQSQLEKQLAKDMPAKFEENIQAFIEYLPDVAAKFRHYQPEVLQMFCAASGDANLIDPTTGNQMYGDEPKQQSIDQVSRTIAEPKFTRLAFGQDENEVNSFIHTNYVSKMYRRFLKAKEELEPMDCVPEHIGSAVMFGIGLGYHLRPLIEQVTIDHYILLSLILIGFLLACTLVIGSMCLKPLMNVMVL